MISLSQLEKVDMTTSKHLKNVSWDNIFGRNNDIILYIHMFDVLKIEYVNIDNKILSKSS